MSNVYINLYQFIVFLVEYNQKQRKNIKENNQKYNQKKKNLWFIY